MKFSLATTSLVSYPNKETINFAVLAVVFIVKFPEESVALFDFVPFIVIVANSKGVPFSVVTFPFIS